MTTHVVDATRVPTRVEVVMEATRTTPPLLYRGRTRQGTKLQIGGLSRARISRILSAVSDHPINDGDVVQVKTPRTTITLNARLIHGHVEEPFIRLQQNCWVGNR